MPRNKCVSAADLGLPSEDLDLFASDELIAVRDLLLLLELGSRSPHSDDMAAINAGCYAALARLERAEAALDLHIEEKRRVAA